jgi:hypothetical protein
VGKKERDPPAQKFKIEDINPKIIPQEGLLKMRRPSSFAERIFLQSFSLPILKSDPTSSG